MQPQTLSVLLWTAASIGVIHTLMGPDHYVPFVAMARVRAWSWPRTMAVVLACGAGHVLGSVALGGLGVAFGWTLGGLQAFESSRGSLAGWLMLGFGLAYTAWGVRRAIRNRPHRHRHVHADGTVHAHEHVHDVEHAHVHEGSGSRVQGSGTRATACHCSVSSAFHTLYTLLTLHTFTPLRSPPPQATHGDAPSDGVTGADYAAAGEAANGDHALPHGNTSGHITGWVLFTIFVFGPCEPLIPFLMVPAAERSIGGLVCVTAVFAAATVATMMGVVTLGYMGVARIGAPSLERYAYALAGLAITACGAAIKLGL